MGNRDDEYDFLFKGERDRGLADVPSAVAASGGGG